MDREKIINEAFDEAITEVWNDDDYFDIGYNNGLEEGRRIAIALLKEQEELLRKLQKDKDKLCLEVSEWKHKSHDTSPKEQEAVEPRRDANCVRLFRCGACGVQLIREDNFCRCCGKRIEWESR